VIDLT
jgi:hypothetical protein